MKLILVLDMNNDAFEHFAQNEAAAALRQAADAVEAMVCDSGQEAWFNGRPYNLTETENEKNRIGQFGVASTPSEIAKVLGPDILRSVEKHRSEKAAEQSRHAMEASGFFKAPKTKPTGGTMKL